MHARAIFLCVPLQTLSVNNLKTAGTEQKEEEEVVVVEKDMHVVHFE